MAVLCCIPLPSLRPLLHLAQSSGDIPIQDLITVRATEPADKLEAMVAEWTNFQTPAQVTAVCQQQGVPAGNMLRLSEFLDNPHYNARKFFRTLNQPTASRPLETENGPVGFTSSIPEPEINPAPVLAQHTREIAKNTLKLSDQDIDELIANGDLEIQQKKVSPLKQKLKTNTFNAVMQLVLKYHALKSSMSSSNTST